MSEPAFDVLAPVDGPINTVQIVTPQKVLDKETIQKAVRALKIKKARVRELSHRAVIGELIQQVGASKIGAQMLMAAEPMMQEGLVQIDKAIELHAANPEVVAMLVRQRTSLVELWVKTAQAHIKSKKDSGADLPQLAPQNIPFPPHTAVQVNVNTQSVDVNREDK